MNVTWDAAGGTHRGRVRKGNEDAIRLDLQRGIFVVADGMGGHAAGEVASAVAADASLEVLVTGFPEPRKALEEAFDLAHRRITDCCNGDRRIAGMGTTLIAALLQEDGGLHLAHIGDSRTYHLSGGALRQLTRDHTWVQREVDSGRIPAEAAKTHPLSHILTRVLSADEPPTPDLISTSVAPHDLLLLCSDGLHNMLDPQQILDILAHDAPATELVKSLIVAANRAGGSDNISVIVVRVLPASD